MHQPARGNLDCEEGKEYTRKRIAQQEKELENLYALTGWAHIADCDEYKKSIVDINTYNIDKSKLDVEKNMDTYRPSSESHRKVASDSVVRSVAPRPTQDLPMPSVDSILPSPEHAPSSSDTIVEKEVLQKVENTPSSSTPWFLIIGVLAASFLGTLGAGIFLRRKNKS
jgi:LPXTG-motif cell wall-anchored protein